MSTSLEPVYKYLSRNICMHRLITIIHSKQFGTLHDCLGIFRYLKVIANEIKHCFQGQVAWPLLCFSFKFTRSWPAIFLGLVIVHFLSKRVSQNLRYSVFDAIHWKMSTLKAQFILVNFNKPLPFSCCHWHSFFT